MKKNTKNITLLITIFACLVLLIAGGSIFLKHRSNLKVIQPDLERLSFEEYNAFFLSMFSIDQYNEEDFTTYRGLRTVKFTQKLSDLHNFSLYMNNALSSANSIEEVYLGIDPVSLWEINGKKDEKCNKSIQEDFLNYVDTNPEIIFEILLPYPQLSYWTSMTNEDFIHAIVQYQNFGNICMNHPNIRLHYIGSEEWLIANPGNYEQDHFCTNEKASHKLALLNFCDKVYLMNPEGYNQKLENLKALVQAEKAAPKVYPDLSDSFFVFFGDSVMVYDKASSSIPGVVCGLTGANCANLSQGGSPATEDPLAMYTFPRMLNAFFQKDPTLCEDGSDFKEGLEDYVEKDMAGLTKDKNYYFVICLGLNDYFGGHPPYNPENPQDIGTYYGALYSGITQLKETYPAANIIIMAPSYCTAFEGGTIQADEDGGVLTDYVEIAKKVASDLEVSCLDVYHDVEINADTSEQYLADGVHPNEDGRFLVGKAIIAFIERGNNNEQNQ